MACSIYLALAVHNAVDQDALVASFAKRHDFDRGYGPATNRLLRLVREGVDWQTLAAGLFDGSGSWGNGAAMRVAPLGAFFADDPAEAARQAALSATVTHTHPEAVAGAIAVAVACVAAHDTVPFTIWAAARHLTSFEQATWATAAAGGDIDTTCAVVGGITASGADSTGLPETWLRAAEPHPEWISPS